MFNRRRFLEGKLGLALAGAWSTVRKAAAEPAASTSTSSGARHSANFTPSSKAFETSSDHFEVWGDGSHSRSFLYADDFARGLIEVAARYPAADPVNLGANDEISIGDMAREIAAIVSQLRGVKIEPRFEPTGLTGQPRRNCDTSKAMRELGFQSQVSFRDGLQRTIRWYADHVHNAVSSHP